MAYVYRHIRLDTNQPFYIGIGSDRNYSRSYTKKRRNQFWCNVAKKTEFIVEIILDDLSWEEACLKEIEFISLYGRRDIGTGILVNMTNGGEGALGIIPYKRTEYHLEKIKQINLGKPMMEETRIKLRSANIGKTASNETREKMSRSQRGKIISKETLEKMSNSQRGRKLDKEHIEKIRLSKMGKKHSNETKKKMSDSQKGKTKNNKMVICYTTGMIFQSVKDAESFFKDSHISKRIKGERKNKYNLGYL
jgi:hypothetical protein